MLFYVRRAAPIFSIPYYDKERGQSFERGQPQHKPGFLLYGILVYGIIITWIMQWFIPLCFFDDIGLYGALFKGRPPI